jgi:hypothetical protein
VAVTASAVAAALGTSPAWADDWSAVLERAVAAADALVSPSAVGGLMTTKSWWVLGVAVAAVGVVSGVWCVQSGRKPDPTPATTTTAATEPVESLAARNDRLFRRDVLPELLAELTRMLPPDNPPRVVGVRTSGTQIECEFVTARAFLPTTKPTGIRVRYCTLRRRMDVFADLHGSGAWKGINPERPIIFDLAIPGLGLPAWDTGHQGIAFGRQAFGKLPIDDRAEAELARAVFGEPGNALTLPQEVRAVTAVGERWFVTTQDSGLFARDGGRWRYRGECPGWFLSAVGDRLYADRDGVETRSVDGTGAAWERVCERPPEDWKKFEVRGMAAAGGQVHYAVHRRTDGATAVWSKRLDDPKAEWRRDQLPVHPGLFTGAGDWLYAAGPEGRLARRSATDSTAKWEPIGRLPADVGLLQAVGDRLLAFDRAKGSIHARSLNGVDVGWQEVGQIHRTD